MFGSECSEFQIAPGRLEGHGRRAKKDIADYVLLQEHQTAVIEAKSWDKEVSDGVGQAKQYAERCLFVLHTPQTGKAFKIDMETGQEQDVDRYLLLMNSGSEPFKNKTIGRSILCHLRG